MSSKFLEDFIPGEIITTQARTITETDLVNYAMFSGDWFPLHTDAEYAKRTMFGERIAHGPLTLSVALGLLVRTNILSPESLLAFYGMDRVRFTKPVKIGDTIKVRAEVIGVQERDERSGILTLRANVENQHGELVCVAELKVLLAKKLSNP